MKLGKIWKNMSSIKNELSVSATGLVAYSSCARKFNWQREERWEYDGPKKANAMCLGSLVHFLIETGLPIFVEPLKSSRPHVDPATATYLASKEIDSWIAGYTDNEHVQTEIYTDIVPYAKFMASQTFNWFEQEKFFNRYEIVSMEEDFAFHINNVGVLRCRPDLVVRDRVTDTLGIVDYKTGTSIDQAPMNADWQMRAMAVVLDTYQGLSVAWGGHLRIKKIKSTRGKPPYVQLNEMRFDEARIQHAKDEIISLMTRIEYDVLHLPSPTWTCASMCSFYDACEAKSALQDWEYVMSIDHKKGTDE